MGLLDGLFGNQSSGGLLDYLNSYLGQTPQQSSPAPSPDMTPTERKLMGLVQPSGAQPPMLDFADRFNAMPNAPQPFMGAGRQFDASTFDPSTFDPQQKLRNAMVPQPAAAPQASPIAIGDYMMPRIGPASAYETQQASIPPNAQPTQGQIPQMPSQAAPLPPALGGQGGGFLNGLSRGLQSIGNGGSLIGALTGNYTDPQSIQQQNLKSQYDATRQALMANGLNEQQASSTALMSVLNPEAAKTVIPELLTNKEKYGVISEDPLEGKKYGFINERDQTVNGKPIGSPAGAPAGGGSLAAVQEAQARGVKGDALYEYLPSQYRSTVKAMIEGRQPLPSTTAMRSPATLAMIDAAHAIDPTFDATTWKARQAGQVDFSSGKSAEMVRSANQTLHHVGQLLDSMDNLKNGQYPMLNRMGNAYSEATGGGAPGAFRTNAHAVAEELSKVFKGANLSDSEIRAWEQNLNENMSPEQQKAQILKLRDLLQGSLHALEEKRVSSIGPMAAEKAGPIIKEEGQRVLERIDKWANGQGAGQGSTSPAISEGMTATNPQTGAKVVFKAGKWVPMQ